MVLAVHKAGVPLEMVVLMDQVDLQVGHQVMRVVRPVQVGLLKEQQEHTVEESDKPLIKEVLEV
jgi:hypothetical protein